MFVGTSMIGISEALEDLAESLLYIVSVENRP